MPLTPEDLYRRVAQDLAALREPDLSDIDPTELDQLVVREFFGPAGANEESIRTLANLVSTGSFGMTDLVPTDPAHFPPQARSWGAAYLELRGVFRSRLLVVRPARPYFWLVT